MDTDLKFFWYNQKAKKIITKGFSGKKTYTIGSTPENTLRIRSEGGIAPRHCSIDPQQDGKLYIRAIEGSLEVDGRDLRPGQMPVEIRHGSTIRMGDRACLRLVQARANPTTSEILDPAAIIAEFAAHKPSPSVRDASEQLASSVSSRTSSPRQNVSSNPVEPDADSNQTFQFTDGPFKLVSSDPAPQQLTPEVPSSDSQTSHATSNADRRNKSVVSETAKATHEEIVLVRAESSKRLFEQQAQVNARPSSPSRRNRSAIAAPAMEYEEVRSPSPPRRPRSPRKQASETEPKETPKGKPEAPSQRPSRSRSPVKRLIDEPQYAQMLADEVLNQEEEDYESQDASFPKKRVPRGRPKADATPVTPPTKIRAAHELPYKFEFPTGPRSSKARRTEVPSNAPVVRVEATPPKKSVENDENPSPRNRTPSPYVVEALTAIGVKPKFSSEEGWDDVHQPYYRNLPTNAKRQTVAPKRFVDEIGSSTTTTTPDRSRRRNTRSVKAEQEEKKGEEHEQEQEPEQEEEQEQEEEEEPKEQQSFEENDESESESDIKSRTKSSRSPNKKRKAAGDAHESSSKRRKIESESAQEEEEEEDEESNEFIPFSKLTRREKERRIKSYAGKQKTEKDSYDVLPRDLVLEIFEISSQTLLDEDEVVAVGRVYYDILAKPAPVQASLKKLVQSGHLIFDEVTEAYSLPPKQSPEATEGNSAM